VERRRRRREEGEGKEVVVRVCIIVPLHKPQFGNKKNKER
jgi:hypothetical protein